MGRSNSPAQLSRDGGFSCAHAGIAEGASSDALAGNSVGEARGVTSRAKSAAAWILLLLVRFYIAFMSPFFGGACKFHPSCSNYAYEAIKRHGARRGLSLAVKRLLRCRPFTKGGFDPVPDASFISCSEDQSRASVSVAQGEAQ
jgi:uncharacterized protein